MNNNSSKTQFEKALNNQNNTNVKNESSCDLFGGMGFFVQFILALICFLVLVIKRFIESPRRPWKIWFFVIIYLYSQDISKQGVSATVIHLLNLLLAVLLSTNGKSDQCIWYFIGNLIDTTVGVFICFIMMYYIEKTANNNNWKVSVRFTESRFNLGYIMKFKRRMIK